MKDKKEKKEKTCKNCYAQTSSEKNIEAKKKILAQFYLLHCL